MQPSSSTEERRMIPLHHKVISTTGKCGHKVVANWPPTNHCDECWTVYFTAQPATVHENFQLLVDGKDEEIKHTFGAKYLKHFKRFVRHVQEVGVAKEQEKELVTA